MRWREIEIGFLLVIVVYLVASLVFPVSRRFNELEYCVLFSSTANSVSIKWLIRNIRGRSQL